MAGEQKPPRAEEEEGEVRQEMSEEEQVRLLLERARQEVKRIVKKEREGEKIARELLNFRMRQVNDA
jgi:hypothetical protein